MPPLPGAPDSLDGRVTELERRFAETPSPRFFAPIAEAYRLSGRLEKAVETARIGVRAYPDHVAIHVVLARALADSGDVAAASEAYESVLLLDPDNAEAGEFAETQAAGEAATDVPGEAAEQVAPGEPGDATEPEVGVEAVAGLPVIEPTAGVGERPRPERRGGAGTLSEELAHLADLFVPSGSGGGSDEAEGGRTGIATLTLAEIYSRQGLPEKAAEVCELILEREPENERARSALESYRARVESTQEATS